MSYLSTIVAVSVPQRIAEQRLSPLYVSVHCIDPLLRQRLPEGCRVELLNALPTDLRRQVSELGAAPLNVFTLEDARETAAVLAGQPCAEKTTTGHWNRPVT